MDTDKIKQVIDFGETQEVEFKELFHSSQKISELMCGFANTYCRVIILIDSKKIIAIIQRAIDNSFHTFQ